ncbi:hypothetical protein BC828DRAFT_386188 [Blastocladiella britannica]|nr:hypothetical protein BC828DRAFT_386188 [Blastocladiella britannica]
MAEKPYKCGCGKDFARRDALLRHCKVVGCSIDSATYTDSSSSPISAAPSSLGDDGHLTGDFAAATAAAPRSSRSPKVDWDECYGPSCGSAAASSAAAYY